MEFGLECSVKDNVSVKEAVLAAYNVSTYPLQALINKETKVLQPNFVKALARIFRLIDDDSDGWLSDRNLAHLQKLVFKMDIGQAEIAIMKEKIAQEVNENAVRYGMNFAAFTTIFKKMLDMIQIKNCWVS